MQVRRREEADGTVICESGSGGWEGALEADLGRDESVMER